LVLLSMIAVACGDDGGGSTSPDGTDPSGATGAAQTPQPGGELTFGEFSETVSLDPVRTQGQGSTGASTNAAIFDTIVRYNPDTRKFEGRTAESFTPNATFDEWTVKLKPGIKFSDGTDYNADAVVFSVKRHQDPSNPTISRATASVIKQMDVLDPLTVKFTLTEQWPGFPFVLSDKVGMIVSPTAVQKYGAAFGTPTGFEGIGAGPFVVSSYRPKEAVVVKKNPSYYNGPVYLDGIRFVQLATGAATYEALKSNTLQAGFLREPQVVDAARKDGYPGFTNFQQAGAILLFNLGASINCVGGKPEPVCTGKPDGAGQSESVTKSLKVRQALIAAIDPKIMNDRVYQGKGTVDGGLFKKEFPWYSADAATFKYDADAAKKLVAEAKAEGWNGKVRILCANTQAGKDTALVAETMWKSVGIEVETNVQLATPDQVLEVTTKKNFDVACWGYSIGHDEGSVNTLNSNLRTPGSATRAGYSSPEMDGLIAEARRASTDEQKTAVYKKVQDLYVKDAVSYPFGAIEEYVAWSKKVHGPVGSQQTVVHFDKAWIEK
jgi:peptide/nickel transport system substrate-binding protein